MVPPAPLFYRHLQMALSRVLEDNVQNYDSLSSEFAHGMLRGAELVGHPDVQMEQEIDS